MPPHILVAYTDDEHGRRVLGHARKLAWRSSARVTLAHVVPPVEDALDPRTDLARELLAVGDDVRQRQRLVTLAAVALPELETDVRVLSGPVVDQLVALAYAERPDLLLVGNGTGHRLTRRVRRGILDGLLTQAPCPVTVVNGRDAPPMVGGDRASDDTMASSHLLTDAAPPVSPANAAHERRSSAPSLLWQLFVADAIVLLAALIVLVVSPVRVSTEVVFREVLILSVGFAVLLALHLVLLRRNLAPLRLLTDVIGTIDPRRPGRRLPATHTGTAEVAALADAFNAMLDRLEHERRESSRVALAAQEEERLRIAREMHDQIGQTLTALIIQAENAADGTEPIRRDAVERFARTASEALEDVRRIGRELRPEALDDLGLGNAIIALCRRTAAQGGVRVVHELQRDVPALRPEVELVVYRIAQEALTNALRHAAAKRVDLSLSIVGDAIELTVSDDGRGLPDPLPEDTAGLSGMRERALLIGGRLTLRSAADHGTTARLSVPLDEAAAR